MNRRLAALLAATAIASAVLVTTPSFAHHAFSAEFDAQQPIEVKGVVLKTKWVNPHSWIYVVSKAADGSDVTWAFEFGTPSNLKNMGLTKNDLPVGTEVTLRGYKSRNGEPVGYTVKVTLADGRSFQPGTPQDAGNVTPASYNPTR